MVRRPTLQDLAKAAGVSIATVDRAINRRLPVSSDTAQRVLQAAESIGYHATSLLKRRLQDLPARRFGFLLQKRHDAFYQSFGSALLRATQAAPDVSAKALLDFTDELVPKRIVDSLDLMAAKCDAIAVVAVDHPVVNEAVERLSAAGKPVFTLLSDISSPDRKSCLSVDTRKAGRTAAWLVAKAARRPGQVAILVGSHRYLSQEMSEISFRSYLREHAPDLQLLEPLVFLDDHRIAYEAVSNLLASKPDLVAIYDSGGGQDGLIKALREASRVPHVIAICNELTQATKSALIDGTLDMALATPIEAMSQQVVRHMIAACDGKMVPSQVLLPAEIHISENL